jgi:hypothetical protein
LCVRRCGQRTTARQQLLCLEKPALIVDPYRTNC